MSPTSLPPPGGGSRLDSGGRDSPHSREAGGLECDRVPAEDRAAHGIDVP